MFSEAIDIQHGFSRLPLPTRNKVMKIEKKNYIYSLTPVLRGYLWDTEKVSL
jgi:hypothetical protein